MKITILVLPLLFSSPFAQSVVVVDDDLGIGVDHGTIQDAIVAAPAGAVILVRPGHYPDPFGVSAKSLTLVAEPGVTFALSTRLGVSDLAPSDRVVLHGFHLDATGDNTNVVTILDGNQGAVWFEDCTFIGTGLAYFSGPETVLVIDSDEVVFRDCHVRGGTALGTEGGPAILASSSSIYVFETLLEGGPGSIDGAGGAAAHLLGGFFFANQSTLVGGPGGSGNAGPFTCFADGGAGGTGLKLLSGEPVARLNNTQLSGGPGGTVSPECTTENGVDGEPFAISTGSLLETSNATRTFEVTSPVRTDETATLELTGPPGEFAFVLFHAGVEPIYLPALQNTLLPKTPHGVVFAGRLDAMGTASLGLAPGLPPGVEARQLFVQPLYFEFVSQSFALGEPSSVVVLDSSF